MKNYVIILLSTVLLLGCERSGVKFEVRFAEYLQTVYSKTIEDALYIVIPARSCDGCRQIVYRNLLSTSHTKKVCIIFSGEVREALTNHYLARLDLMGVELLSDSKGLARNYGLIQEEYPMSFISFLDVIDGEVVSYEILKPDMIQGEIDIRQDIFKNYIN